MEAVLTGLRHEVDMGRNEEEGEIKNNSWISGWAACNWAHSFTVKKVKEQQEKIKNIGLDMIYESFQAIYELKFMSFQAMPSKPLGISFGAQRRHLC